jgi:hypothetical protein
MIVEEECDDGVYYQGWDLQGELIAPNLGPTSFQKERSFFKHCLSYPPYLHHTSAGEWLGYFCLHLKHLAHDSQPSKH